MRPSVVVALSLLTGAIRCAAFSAEPQGIAHKPASPHLKLRSVALNGVTWTEGFWADKARLCREVMLPGVARALHDQQNGAYLNNFRVAAGLQPGKHQARHWSDGDCYKWLEAVARTYAVTQDKELDRLMDQWIATIGKAQERDGYISTNVQLDPGKERWQNVRHHELYNLGHLLTAACLHHRATGKDTFLKIARKAGDYLYATFQPQPRELARFGFNPSNIMGAADLYRATGDRRYLDLAATFVAMRGSAPATAEETKDRHHLGGTDCTQDRIPLRRETEAVGHCVCATYLYAGAADVCAETGDRQLQDALERIWRTMTTRRMYVTGAIGSFQWGQSSRGDWVHEAFGRDYELPSRTAYCETCSNIGNAMWNWRMLGLTGEAKYADVMELVLYNSMLSAVGIDGNGFFYCNPLKRDGRTDGLHKHHAAVRKPTLSCFCCPPQVIRTIAKAHTWAYSVGNDTIWVHLYGGNVLETKLPDGSPVKLTQKTDYPWEGTITITVDRAPARTCALSLRIPGWAEGAALTINGTPHEQSIRPGTYAAVRRIWSPKDVLQLHLPLNVRLMEAHPAVKNLHNKVAVMRGPVVYCAEFPLRGSGKRTWEEGVFLPESVTFTPRYEADLLGGVVTLRGQALTAKGREQFIRQTATAAPPPDPTGWTDRLYRPMEVRNPQKPSTGTLAITLIPYYAWANRGVLHGGLDSSRTVIGRHRAGVGKLVAVRTFCPEKAAG